MLPLPLALRKIEKITYSKKNSKKKTNKDKLKPFGLYHQLYLQNIWLKFLINRIKIDRFRALRRGPETGAKTGSKTGSKNFPTDCYGEINKYEWRPSGFMKKMNEGLYRVTRFARDNKLSDPLWGSKFQHLLHSLQFILCTNHKDGEGWYF